MSTEVTTHVTGHYGRTDVLDSIMAALTRSGVDLDRLTWQDLTPVDELHAGFLGATRAVLDLLDPEPGCRLLDVGSGLGGPSRVAAAERGCDVVGIDLTPAFVDAATALTERVGLADRARFVATSGEALPFEDDSVDAAMMIHVGMNVPDKTAVFREVARVLRPGGRFVVYDQMLSGYGRPEYPMPWADDERSSFLASPDEYRDHLADAGLEVVGTHDLTDLPGPPTPPVGAGGAGGQPPALSPMAVFGEVFAIRIKHNVAATNAGVLSAVAVVAQAPTAGRLGTLVAPRAGRAGRSA